jgi:hypothetical protein
MPMLPDKWQVRSKEQFVPCLCFVIDQTTSSIQRTVCTNLHVVILIKPQVRSKEQLVSSFLSMPPGQIASSIQRTVCTCLSVCIFNQATSSIQRTTCIFLYVHVSGQVPSSIQRTACTCLEFLFPVKRQVRSEEQLVPISCLYSMVKWLVRSKEQLVPFFCPLVCLPCQCLPKSPVIWHAL